MRPLNHAKRGDIGAAENRQPGDDGDVDTTCSYSDSDSDDGVPDPPELQLLARALFDWDPVVVTAFARLQHAEGAPAAFADFLARLNVEVGQRNALRGEIIGWLRTMVHHDANRDSAFQVAVNDKGRQTALELYEAMRRAMQ